MEDLAKEFKNAIQKIKSLLKHLLSLGIYKK